MKTTDIALLILIGAAAFGLSFMVIGWVLPNPDELYEKISYYSGITSDVQEPDIESFNPTALNPTVDVYVGTCDIGYIWDSETQSCVSKSSVEDSNKNTCTDSDGKEYASDDDCDVTE